VGGFAAGLLFSLPFREMRTTYFFYE
jgi:hypothetical protein